jgi:hypothetical protein
MWLARALCQLLYRPDRDDPGSYHIDNAILSTNYCESASIIKMNYVSQEHG